MARTPSTHTGVCVGCSVRYTLNPSDDLVRAHLALTEPSPEPPRKGRRKLAAAASPPGFEPCVGSHSRPKRGTKRPVGEAVEEATA